MDQKIEIILGLFSEPIEKQLKRQGLIDKNVKTHQKINDSISCLYITGYITNKQKEKMHNKLANEIIKSCIAEIKNRG